MWQAPAKIRQKRFQTLVCVVLSVFALSGQAADSNLLRVAFGRFLSTKDPGSSIESLPAFFVQQKSVTPFQLVGTKQTADMVAEQFGPSRNSASNSVDTSSAAMLRFGRSVGADLLITGLIIPHPYPRESTIWVKAVDVRTGIVRDARLISECMTNSKVTLNRITEFVSKAPHVPPRQELVALGPIIDLNPRTNHSRFPRHVQLLLERFCYENGLGLVWRDAVTQGQDKVASPKWFVDGTYESSAGNALSIDLCLHKSGCKPSIEKVVALPGAQLDEALVAAFKRGLARTNWVPASAAEADLDAHWAMRRAQDQEVIAQTGQRVQKRLSSTLESLESKVRLNPNDLKSKVALAEAILFKSEADTERAIQMLAEAMQSNDKEIAAAAKFALENTKPPPPNTEPAPAPQAAAPVKELDPEEKRIAFLQQNFAKFVHVRFQKGSGTNAVIQRLKTRENRLEHNGMYYSGFRFTVPESIDGHFLWMWLMDKSKAQKDFVADGASWYIVPERGRMKGFSNFERETVSDFKGLQQQFPYTQTLYVQTLAPSRFSSGKTYAIWFMYKEPDFPDIAFAMTIDTERGRERFGALPIH